MCSSDLRNLDFDIHSKYSKMDESKRARRLGNQAGKFSVRAETFHQMLMEDFRFMEAARTQSGEYEAATLSTDDLKRNLSVSFVVVALST